MELKKWNYKGFEIEESLKPDAEKFQYFFRVEEEGTKKCTFCVWMTDDVVNTKSNKESIIEKFEDIIKSDRETWSELPHPDGWGFLRVLRTISEDWTGYFRFTFGCVSQITKKLFIARPPGIL